MERKFDAELNELDKEILKMAGLVEEAIYKSIESLKALDPNLAREVIDKDTVVDELELAIDESCLDLIALRQPVAQDLRFITGAMKITTDLERMADLAVDIAERTIELKDKPLLKPLIDIPKLAILAEEMVRRSINAFVNRDADLAKKVILSDDEADRLRDLVQQELIYEYMAKDCTASPRAIPLILVARHLERICDHATNIAEDVVYMVQAKVVKHHPEKLG